MARMIDQIRASKLPSGMMQFAARGALQVPAAENIEILVYLAVHNKVFGELARMTLAGWDEKASRVAAGDPQTPPEVLNYMISPDNLRPALLPELLENPSLPEAQMVKLAVSAGRETIEALLMSARVRSLKTVLETLKTNPYLKREEAEEIRKALAPGVKAAPVLEEQKSPIAAGESGQAGGAGEQFTAAHPAAEHVEEIADPEGDESVSVYMKENANEIAAEGEKKFQAIGWIGESGSESTGDAEAPPAAEQKPAVVAASAATAAAAAAKKHAVKAAPERQNTLQKINSLDVKGRIQLALKGNKEERSILIRDGTKVVALAVLEAPKLADGEVEKFASQKNVLEAVLRQIPLKRRFMKNYIVVRNLVANPRTPIDLSLGLMKNLLTQDLKNLSTNKEVSETIRKLALKMYKQKLEAANKK